MMKEVWACCGGGDGAAMGDDSMKRKWCRYTGLMRGDGCWAVEEMESRWLCREGGQVSRLEVEDGMMQKREWSVPLGGDGGGV